jgi:predicted transcriptional regulator of viral defense system
MEPLRPSWDALYEIAASQGGFFTTQQAAAIGYSVQLLAHHLKRKRIERVRHGIYRLVHFPFGEHEDLIAAWLWSDQAGVASNQTALALRGLSDAMPSQVHITLPSAWRTRRLRVPPHVELHYADVPAEDREWFGVIPVTRVQRTLNDCARDKLSPDLLRQAAHQALARGLVVRDELRDVARALVPFGGLAA